MRSSTMALSKGWGRVPWHKKCSALSTSRRYSEDSTPSGTSSTASWQKYWAKAKAVTSLRRPKNTSMGKASLTLYVSRPLESFRRE